MKAKILLRLSAACLLFFAAGHSIGHFSRHNVTDPKAREILKLMAENKFDMFGKMRSYDENYTGMSLNLIFTLLALAAILWLISGITEKQPQFARNLLVPIALCVFGFSITSYLFFFTMPAVTCLLASMLIALSIYKLREINTI